MYKGYKDDTRGLRTVFYAVSDEIKIFAKNNYQTLILDDKVDNCFHHLLQWLVKTRENHKKIEIRFSKCYKIINT